MSSLYELSTHSLIWSLQNLYEVETTITHFADEAIEESLSDLPKVVLLSKNPETRAAMDPLSHSRFP